MRFTPVTVPLAKAPSFLTDLGGSERSFLIVVSVRRGDERCNVVEARFTSVVRRERDVLTGLALFNFVVLDFRVRVALKTVLLVVVVFVSP